LLLDVNFKKVSDIKTLERNLTIINGVIDTSLFVGLVTKALISGKNGINIISKNN
jgi:Ribose 5-phosphate isomerase A (phosphoriboisomerase A).